MFNLTELPQRYIDALGREQLAQVVGQTENVVAMWIKRGKFPIDALQRLLEHDPAPLAAVRPLWEPIPCTGKLMILVPLSCPPNPHVMDCLVRLYDRREMLYHRESFNCLSVARNAAIARGLKTQAEWFFWLDGGDTIVPAGDPAWYKQAANLPNVSDVYAGVHTIYRLLAHRLKLNRQDATFVSCSYVSKKTHGDPQFGNSQFWRDTVRHGPIDKLIDVPWVGFGGVLTHRSVFEDIIRTQGDEIKMGPNSIGSRFGYDYGFFSPLDRHTPGDDIPFCHRARKAGHKIYVDLAVQGAHFGERVFTFNDL